MDDPRSTCASWWLPRIIAAGLPVPETRMHQTDAELIDLCDGQGFPDGLCALILWIKEAGEALGGAPLFLRTGLGSGKHDWSSTCYLPDLSERSILRHVAAIVEWSNCVDIFGLATDVWMVRRLIPTAPLFHCKRYGDFPVTREFRIFADEGRATHLQPYWPPDPVENGQPDDEDWRAKLAAASRISDDERSALEYMAVRAAAACGGGEWSADFLQDAEGAWWLTDMAEGARSFKWTNDAQPQGDTP